MLQFVQPVRAEVFEVGEPFHRHVQGPGQQDELGSRHQFGHKSGRTVRAWQPVNSTVADMLSPFPRMAWAGPPDVEGPS
ncbi:hypothetical protein GCM10027262_57060 [Nocardia tengchongensis]